MKGLMQVYVPFGCTGVCFSSFHLTRVCSTAEGIYNELCRLLPAPHKQAVLVDQWCKEIEKRTDGRVKVTPFHGATLTPAAMIYDSVTKGIADIGMGTLGYSQGKIPFERIY